MKLHELIAAAGEKLVWQTIAENATKIEIKDDQGVITFVCSPAIASNLIASVAANAKPQYIGFVVWLPTESIPK